jgi:hypothetical protein
MRIITIKLAIVHLKTSNCNICVTDSKNKCCIFAVHITGADLVLTA